MGFQLAGEAVVALTGLNFPGSAVRFAAHAGVAGATRRSVGRIVSGCRHLDRSSGLVLWAGGGGHHRLRTLLLSDGMAIAGALLLSTGFAIAVAGLLGGAPSAQSLHRRPE